RGLSVVWGRAVGPANVARLIGDALATLAEFGEPGMDVQALTDGPFADPRARTEFQNRALRRTARRLARLSPFYAERFVAAGVDPAALDLAGLPRGAGTGKGDLVRRAAGFPGARGEPCVTTRTTGTTGRAAPGG